MQERDVGLSLLEQSREKLREGEGMVAARLAERAAELLVGAGEAQPACAALALAGHARMRGGDLSEARASLEQLIQLAEQHELTAQATAARTDLGALLEISGQFDAALELHRGLLRQSADSGDLLNKANAAGNVGRLLTRTQHTEEAEDLLLESLEGFRDLGHALGEANARICLGDLFRNHDRPNDAEEHFSKAAELAREGGAPALRAVALLNMGHLLRDRSEHEPALDAFVASANLCERLGDVAGLARAKMGEGLALSDLLMAQEAMEALSGAEQGFLQVGQSGAALAAAVNKAAVQCRAGHALDALGVLQEARVILSKVGDPRGLCEVTLALCEINLLLGDAGATERLLAELDQDVLSGRLLFRASLLESKLALRSLQLEEVERRLEDLESSTLNPWERFALEMLLTELAILRHDPAHVGHLKALRALAEESMTERERAMVSLLDGQAALWRGDLEAARQGYRRARSRWKALREPLSETQSQSALLWLDLLFGQRVHPGEVRELEDEARERGQRDQADILAGLAVVAAAEGVDEASLATHLSHVLSPLVERGHRLAATLCMTLAAAITGHDALRANAAQFAVGTGLEPPKLGPWAVSDAAGREDLTQS